jgi:hypothetical protein
LSATVHCLTGCAIGEVLGMVFGSAFGLHNAATVAPSVVLAFVFGYALTMRGVLRSGVGFTQVVQVALAADTVSIAVMELIDNTIIVAVPGAMDAGPDSLGRPGLFAGDRFPGHRAGQQVDDRQRPWPRRRAQPAQRARPLASCGLAARSRRTPRGL